MKKLICLILCFCTFLTFVGCKSNTELTSKISDKIDFKLQYRKTVWLDNSSIETITLKTLENGKQILVFTATEKGSENLFKESSANIGAILSLTVNDYLLDSPTVYNAIEDGTFVHAFEYTDARYLFNYLTGEEDLMKNVNPPDYLISEEDAQNKAFTYVDISAADATKVVTNLIIDNDYFGWKYTISFTANGGKYKIQVNAYNGSILNFD